MNKEPKVYCPGSAKQISPNLLKLNFPVAEFIALVQQHASNGWISLAVSPRKEVGPKGQTHSVWVDKWKPQSAPANPDTAKQAFAQMKQAAAEAAPQDDVPF